MDDVCSSKIETTGEERIKCIDAFRGMTIALMLLVNNPGNVEHCFVQLRHSKWNGCTVADLAFPLFIIIMGMVVPFSINRRIEKGTAKLKIIFHVLLRSIIIFLLGLFLNGFPKYDMAHIRILGVLQRIAIVYLLASIIYLTIRCVTNKNVFVLLTSYLAMLFIIILYLIIIKNVFVPGYGKGILQPKGNLVQYIDLRFLKGHMYTAEFDPEGLLSTFPSVGSALIGVIVGQIFISDKLSKISRVLVLIAFGIVNLIFAYIFNLWFPFNKNLWSSSFVLLTGALAVIFISIIYIFMDLLKAQGIFKPFSVLGCNAILIYIVSEFISNSLFLIPVYTRTDGSFLYLNKWITTYCIEPWAGNKLDSLYFSILYIIFWMFIAKKLHKDKIYIKI